MMFESKEGLESPLSAHSADLFSRILGVMEKNIYEKISVNELAKACNISVPTLEKTVYKYLGYGAMNHYNTLKMNRAQSMLLSGMSVKEVSLTLGFSNQNYFSERFKKHYGYPPSSSRKRITD